MYARFGKEAVVVQKYGGSSVANPERILQGAAEELLAVRETEAGKWLVVVYRQLSTMVSSSPRS